MSCNGHRISICSKEQPFSFYTLSVIVTPFFPFQVSSVQNQETQWQKIHVNTVPRAGGSCESPPWDLENRGWPLIHNRRASASCPWLSGSAGAWSCSIQRRTELPTRMCNLKARGVTRGRGHTAQWASSAFSADPSTYLDTWAFPRPSTALKVPFPWKLYETVIQEASWQRIMHKSEGLLCLQCMNSHKKPSKQGWVIRIRTWPEARMLTQPT